jgi:hypothetical protein
MKLTTDDTSGAAVCIVQKYVCNTRTAPSGASMSMTVRHRLTQLSDGKLGCKRTVIANRASTYQPALTIEDEVIEQLIGEAMTLY